MKKLMPVAAMIAFICAGFAGCYMFSAKDSYYGVKTTGKHIVFLVDISGSMEGKNEGNISDKMRAQAMNRVGDKLGSMIKGPVGGLVAGSVRKESTKLASAKRELLPAIKGLSEGNTFTIVAFESNVKTWKDNLAKPTAANKALAQTYIKRLSSMGGTSALKGLKTAFGIKGVDMIFFLSDGHPSDASADKILKEVQALNSKGKVTVNSIGLGDDKDERFMKELASQNNGIYVEK